MQPTIFLVIGVTSMSLLQLLYLASIHPEHSFFGHLVSVLGSREFSAPICMLLLEKSANRVIRQTSADDVHASLSLPISVFQHGNYSQQIYVRYLSILAGGLFH
jgi:hypothetical protein